MRALTWAALAAVLLGCGGGAAGASSGADGAGQTATSATEVECDYTEPTADGGRMALVAVVECGKSSADHVGINFGYQDGDGDAGGWGWVQYCDATHVPLRACRHGELCIVPPSASYPEPLVGTCP